MMKSKSFWFFLSFLFFILGCSSMKNLANRQPSSTRVTTPWTQQDLRQFPKILDNAVVKFVAWVKPDGSIDKVEYFDPRVYQFHYQYLNTLPEYKDITYQQFVEMSKKAEGRKFWFGMIAWQGMDSHEGNWAWWIRTSLNADDIPTAVNFKRIEKLSKAWWKKNTNLSAAVSPGEEEDDSSESDPGIGHPIEWPYVLQPTDQQREMAQQLKASYEEKGLEIVSGLTTNDRRSYTEGWGIGRIVVIENDEHFKQLQAQNQIHRESILILKNEIQEIPPVAGIISMRPLTEVSHIVLLAQMYGIPLVYEKASATLRQHLRGQYLLLRTEGPDQFSTTLIQNENDLNELRQMKRMRRLNVRADWTARAILPVEQLSSQSVASNGGKAIQMGLIRRVIPKNSPSPALSIPLSYFRAYMDQAQYNQMSLGQFVQTALGSLGPQASSVQISAVSEQIREAFKKAEISSEFFEGIRNELRKYFPQAGQRLKLRSSSNVEDGAEFNGAGLYESHGVCLFGCEKDDFRKDLSKVWSSLYTARGIQARREFGVDESQVGMGILVHAPYKGELMNGVVRLKRAGEAWEIMVSAVPGEEESVTNAQAGGANEVVMMNEEGIVSHRPYGQYPKGRLLMNPQHYDKLRDLLFELEKKWPDQVANLDIEGEWKLISVGGEERVDLKQIRRVPQVVVDQIQNANWKVFTGGRVRFVTRYEDSQVWVNRYRVEQGELILSSFSSEDFKNRRLRFGPMKIKTPKGNFEFQFDRIMGIETYERDYYPGGKHYSMKVKYKHPAFKNIELSLSMSELANGLRVLTPHSQDFKINISEMEQGDLRYRASLVFHEAEMNALLMKGEESFIRARQVVVDACETSPRLVFKNGVSRHRFVDGGSEFRIWENTEIHGLLPRKPVIVSGFPHAIVGRNLHDGSGTKWYDLSEATNLTAVEKAKVLRDYGHYLEIDTSGGGTFPPRFFDENFLQRGKKGQSCEGILESEGVG